MLLTSGTKVVVSGELHALFILRWAAYVDHRVSLGFVRRNISPILSEVEQPSFRPQLDTVQMSIESELTVQPTKQERQGRETTI
jgi:hypothetical protein